MERRKEKRRGTKRENAEKRKRETMKNDRAKWSEGKRKTNGTRRARLRRIERDKEGRKEGRSKRLVIRIRREEHIERKEEAFLFNVIRSRRVLSIGCGPSCALPLLLFFTPFSSFPFHPSLPRTSIFQFSINGTDYS